VWWVWSGSGDAWAVVAIEAELVCQGAEVFESAINEVHLALDLCDHIACGVCSEVEGLVCRPQRWCDGWCDGQWCSRR